MILRGRLVYCVPARIGPVAVQLQYVRWPRYWRRAGRSRISRSGLSPPKRGFICVTLSVPVLTMSCGSMGVCRLRVGVHIGDRDLPVLQWRCGREARDLQDFLFVEGFPLQQGSGERLELLAMFGQESPGHVVAFAYDPVYLGVHDAGGLLAEGLLRAVTARSTQVRVFAGREFYRPQLLAHSPAGDHSPREVGSLLYVAFRPCGPGAVDDLLRYPSPQGADDPRPQVPFRVVVAVVLGALVGDAQGLSPRHDRHPVYGVSAGHDESQDGVTALVVGDALPLLWAHQQRALGAEHDLLQSVQEVLLGDFLLLTAGRQERRLVDQIPEIGARKPRRRSRELPKVHATGERHASGVDLENRLAPHLVREVHHHAPVEAPGPQECLVEHVGLVGGGQHDHALLAGETIHLGQDLVEGLLLLARSPHHRLTAGPSYGIELVDKDDRRGVLAGLLEEVAHATSADAHEQLDELRGAQGEERYTRLARDGPRQERLARSRGSHQEHAFRCRSPKAGVLLGVLEKVHDLDELVLRLIYAGDVVEGDLRVLLLVVAPGAAPTDAREGAAHTATLLLSAPIEPDVAADQEQRRTEGEEERLPPATAFLYRLGADLDAVVDQQLLEAGVHEGGKHGGEGLGGARRPRVRLRASLSFRWVGDRLLEAALDSVPLAVDRLDVAAPHLLFEERVWDLDCRFRPWEEEPDYQEIREQYEREPQPTPSGRHAALPFGARLTPRLVRWAPGRPGG